ALGNATTGGEGIISTPGGAALTIGSVISNTAASPNGLTIGGAGTLTLSGINTEVGIVALTSGTLTLGTATATLGVATNILAISGGTISANATSIIANQMQLNSGPGYVTFGGSSNITLNGVISGAGSLAFNMAAPATTVTYGSQTNTYTGVTNVLQG